MIINIYHTNDIHSNYDFMKKVHHYIRKHKTEDDFYIDGGDFLDLSSIIVESDGGKQAMDLIMDAKLDLMTVGNNEMDLGKEKLESILEKGFPIISSNIRDLNDKNLRNLTKSMILERKGIRFLFLGVTPYFSDNLAYASYNKYFEMGDFRTVDPIPTLVKELKKYKGKYDYCILNSHSGHIVDAYIKEKIPEIDLILGAHTHLIVTEKNYTMSGRGEAIGKLTLEVSYHEIKVIDSVQIILEDVENEKFDHMLTERYVKSINILNKELKFIDDLDFHPFKENRLINFLCDALYKEYKKNYNIDFALMQNGIAENSLFKPVTKLDVIQTFPSKLNPTIFEVSGKNIKDAIKLSFDEKFICQNGKAAGFRGHILGALSVSKNVKINKNPFRIFIDDKLIEDEKSYTIISTDYLQRGSCYKMLKNKNDIYIDKYFIKEFVLNYFEDNEIFESSKIRRIL